MKLKVWQWVVLGLLAYFIFLVKYMPASWLIHSDMVQLPKEVEVVGVSDTIWQGKIERVLVKGVSINQVSWDLSFWSLLLAQVDIDVKGGQLRQQDDVYLKGNLSASLLNKQAFSVSNFTILVPAQAVMRQFQLPIPVTAKGRFKADIARLEFDKKCEQLSGSGGWNNGEVGGRNGPIKFGSFDALLSCDKGDIQVAVQDNNKLQLDALVTLSQNGEYSVLGRFNIPEDMPDEVQQAASFFGPTDSQGFRTIEL